MKRIVSFILVLAMLLCSAAFAEAVRIGALKGPTAMGLVQMLSAADEDKYEFTLAGSADELTPLFLKGELDIIAAPVNLGSVLYNKTEGKIRFLAVNALGVLYIVEKGGETVNSVEDLRGRTIYATGKGSTPEYSLRYILSANGVDPDNDVTIEWKTEPTETVAALNAADNAVAMMPQPYVTAARGQVEGLRVALDLTEEWEKVDPEHTLITAGIITTAAFVESNPEAVDAFLADFAVSAAFANENVAENAALCEQYDIIKAAVAEKALPACHIVCVTGEDARSAVGNYLTVLFDQDPAAVGGAVPADDFYYVP